MSSSSVTRQRLAAVQDEITDHDIEIKRLERRLEDLRDYRRAAKARVERLEVEFADAKKKEEQATSKNLSRPDSDDSDWSSDDARIRVRGGRVRYDGKGPAGWERYGPRRAFVRDPPEYRIPRRGFRA